MGWGPSHLPCSLDMPVPQQRSSHTRDRGVPLHFPTHFTAVGWAPLVSIWLLSPVTEPSFHPIRQNLFPRISREKSEARRSHGTSPITQLLTHLNWTLTQRLWYQSLIPFQVEKPRLLGNRGKWLCMQLDTKVHKFGWRCGALVFTPHPPRPFLHSPGQGREQGHCDLLPDLASKGPTFQFPQGN